MSAPRKRRRGRTVLIWIFILAAVGSAAFFLVPRPGAVKASNVVIESLEQGRFVREVTGSGVIEAVRQRALAFGTSGTVARILVEEGDPVLEGQILARLDDAELQRSLASTRASLSSAQADLSRTLAQQEVDSIDATNAVAQAEDRHANARADLRDRDAAALRTQRLLELGAASQDELRAAQDAAASAARSVNQAELALSAAETRLANQVSLAEAQRASAEANVSRLETDLANLEARVDEGILRAPFGGVVATLSIEEGDAVGTQVVLEVANLEDLRVRASFDENRASELVVGMPADIVPDADTRLRLPAVVERLSPVAARGGGAAQVDVLLRFDSSAAALLQGDDARVRPGYTVTARVRVAEVEEAFLVPLEALSEEDGDEPGEYLYVIEIDESEDGPSTTGVARRVAVTPIEENPTVAALALNTTGLSADTVIAVVGIDALKDGVNVTFPPLETP